MFAVRKGGDLALEGREPGGFLRQVYLPGLDLGGLSGEPAGFVALNGRFENPIGSVRIQILEDRIATASLLHNHHSRFKRPLEHHDGTPRIGVIDLVPVDVEQVESLSAPPTDVAIR